MIDPLLLREKVAEVTANIPEIKRKMFVASDDELAEDLQDHKKADNILLMSVIPSYGGHGEEDNAGTYSYLQFFFLEKVDSTSFKNSDEYLAVFSRTLAALRRFLAELFEVEVLNCSRDQLQFDFTIRAVSRKAQCNGYELQIDSKSFMPF